MRPNYQSGVAQAFEVVKTLIAEYIETHERHQPLRNYVRQLQRNMINDPYLQYCNWEEDRQTVYQLAQRKVELRELIYRHPTGKEDLSAAIYSHNRGYRYV